MRNFFRERFYRSAACRHGCLWPAIGLIFLSRLFLGVAAAEPLRLAFPHKIQYLPMMIHCHDGSEKISPVVGTGGIDAAEALLAGAADVGAMGDVPALILLSRNSRFQVVCAFMQSPSMHRLVARVGLDSLTDLYGKRLAVHHGSSTHGALLAHCAEKQVEIGRISLVPLSPVNFPEALLNGAVDAIAGSEPWPQNVLDRVPQSLEVATLTVRGNQFPHLLVADRDFMAAQASDLAALLGGLKLANQLINEKPLVAAEIAARFTNRAPAVEAATLARLHYGLDFSPAVSESLAVTAEFLQRQRKIKRLPALAAMQPLIGLRP